MDPADIFRQGFSHVAPRQNPVFMGHPQHPMVQFQSQMQQQPFRKPAQNEEPSDGDGSSHRIAHTLTACCRCRQVLAHPLAPPWIFEFRVNLLLRREKPDAILPYPAVYRVKDRGLHVNI